MDWISDPLDRLQWALWHFIATIFWAVDRLVLIGAVLIHTLRKWITNPGGIIDLVMSSMLQGEGAVSLKTFMAGAILLALILAAFIFILRPIIGSGHSPVDLRKVFLWLALAGYLFSTGGAIFTSMEAFRSQLSSSAYQIAASVNGSVGSGGYNNTGGEVPLNSSEPFSPTVQLFAYTTHVYGGSQEYTGIDVAAAYMFATQEDVNGTNNGGTGLPAGFEAQYFTNDGVSPWPSNYNSDQRQAALNKAVTGVIRMGTGIVPSIFAIQQAIIFLALALAAAIIIFSLPIALVFAFFTATEVITFSVLRAYMALLIKTYVTAMILAIFMGFLKFWADSQNWVAFLGMSLLITYFTFHLAHMAVQTITQSLNVVTQAIGQATGTQVMYFDPIKMTGQAVGLAATAGIAAATGGSSLMAGTLISGAADMGAEMPGLRTLGYGLAVRSRKPGEYASDALKASSQGTAGSSGTPGGAGAGGSGGNGPGPTTPPTPPPAQQQVNSYLQANGIPPIQPTTSQAPSVQAAPTSTLPPTVPFSTLTPVTPGTQGTQGTQSGPSVHATQHLPLPSGAANGPATTASPAHSAKNPAQNQGLSASSGSTSDKGPQEHSTNGSGAAQILAHVPNNIAAPGENGGHATADQATLAAQTGSDDPAFAPVRVRPVKDRDASIGPVLADIVKGRPESDMPSSFQNLPREAQKALLGLSSRAYRPRDVAAIADATRTVVGVMQYQHVPLDAIPRLFTGPDGNIDVHSRGVRDTLEQAGLASWMQGGNPEREADLAYIVGASLQLERTFNASQVGSAIGQAADMGGSADTAADLLGVSPSAGWGGRYGSIQSVIARAPLFGLSSGEAVQRFVGLAQRHPLDELVSGKTTGLSAEQQALLDGVRARAAELATAETGDTGEAAAEAVLKRYLRDARNVPVRITAPIVPVRPEAPVGQVGPAVPRGQEEAPSGPAEAQSLTKETRE